MIIQCLARIEDQAAGSQPQLPCVQKVLPSLPPPMFLRMSAKQK